jgi:histidinol phosphatase-like enzyme (inositol monophosphatase family)
MWSGTCWPSLPPVDDAFDVAPVLDEVTELVRAASRLALRWYRRDHEVENKLTTGFDPVTAADRAVEDHLRAGLQARFPGHEVLGEEAGLSGSGRYRWVIDPIDGTRAFISGNPLWGTLLGLQDGGRPVAGWLHQPTLDETWVAGAGTARHRTPAGERALRVRPTTALAEATVLCTTPEMFDGADAEAFSRVAATARLTRYGGDCINYGLLALGCADAVVDDGLAPYDIVPLIPIVEAAGGVVTDRHGGPATEGGFVIASATPALHDEILSLLAL